MSNPFTIYFAGDLFDHKHLIGNAILASYIETRSEGQYKCIVPQDLEQPVGRGCGHSQQRPQNGAGVRSGTI